MSKKVLVTGAYGFVGKSVVQELLDRGVDLIALDSSDPTTPLHKTVRASILDYEAVAAAVQQYNPTAIIHLAAIAAPVYDNVPLLYEVNVCGTENVLKAAQAYGQEHMRVVLVSTAGVYGNQDEPLDHEDMLCRPMNHYAYTKLINEHMIRLYPELDICAVRPFTIVGNGQRNAFLIPKLTEAFSTRQAVIKLGNLDAKRDYIDVNYCAYVIAELALRDQIPYRILNICSGVSNTVMDIVHTLEQITGHSPEIRVDQRFVRTNEVWSMVGSTERLLDFLDGKKACSLEKVLQTML